jgi:hypothetical protein
VVRSDANRSAIHYDFSQDFLAHAAFPFMANDSPISSASLYVNFLWQQQTALPTLAHSGPDEAKRNIWHHWSRRRRQHLARALKMQQLGKQSPAAPGEEVSLATHI